MGKDRLCLEIFDVLDTTLCGFLTAEQLHVYYETANFTQVPFHVIVSALHHVCGVDVEECRRDQFLSLLAEIRRRQQLTEQIFWDFRSLDVRNQGRLSLKDALFLFKTTLQDSFSLKAWDSFIANRAEKDADVTLVELQVGLLNPPMHGQPASTTDIYTKEAQLEGLANDRDFEEYSMLMELQRDPDMEEAKNKEWRRSLRQESRKKVKQISRYGLDGVLMSKAEVTFDDADELEDKPETKKDKELTDLEMRYENAKGRLLWEMLRLKTGEVEWAAMPNEEKQARLGKLKASEKKLQKDGLFDQIGCLLGSAVSLVVDINALVGPKQRHYDKIMKEKMLQRTQKLAAGQRLSPDERERMSDDIFVELQLRYDKEREAIVSRYSQQQADKVTKLMIEKALERKYEVLEESLFIAALREKLGDVEWDMMTPEQREAKRVKLKLQLNRERKERQINESLDQIVGDGGPKQARISLLFGDMEGQEDIQFPKECNVRETFMEIKKRKELEWQRLDSCFDPQSSQKDWQLQLAQLLCARECARCETSFHRAVVVAGLCEKFGSLDRAVWLAELAAEREKAIRIGDKALQVVADSGLLEIGSGLLSIQERIIKELVRKHSEEMALLLQMAADPTVQQQIRNVKKLETKEQQERVNELAKERKVWRHAATRSSVPNQMSFLEEAFSLRSAVVHSKLTEQQDSTLGPITHSSVTISISVALQQLQQEEMQETMQKFLGEGRSDLFRLLETQSQLWSGGYYDNLATVLLHVETTELEGLDVPEVQENEKSGGKEGKGEEGEDEEGQIVELTKEDELKMMQDLEKKFVEEKGLLLKVLTNKDQLTRLSPERPMSASLQKRISEFKMRRLMSEDPGVMSDSEMDFRRHEQKESAKKQIGLRIKLLQKRKREKRHQRVVSQGSDEATSDSDDLTTTAKPDLSVGDIPTGTQLMLDNEEAKRKMKELERLFELKKQALVKSIEKHEKKTQELKKSGSTTSSLDKEMSDSAAPSPRRSKSRLKQRTLTQLQTEAELVAQRAFFQESLRVNEIAIPEDDVVQVLETVPPQAASIVPSVQVTPDTRQLDVAKQQEIAGSLVTQATVYEKSVEDEKSRQSEIVKNRLLQLKNRRQSELTMVLGEGQKQKEQLESKMKEEKERQLARVKERVTQVRHERTLTMSTDTCLSDGEDLGFAQLLTEDERQLDVDERMAAAARRMQEAFYKQAEEEASSPQIQRKKATLDIDSHKTTTPRSIHQRLKERKTKRKERKLSSTLETYTEDEESDEET